MTRNVPTIASTTNNAISIQPQGTRISSGRTAAGGTGTWGSVGKTSCGGTSVFSSAGSGGRDGMSADSTGWSGGGLFSSRFMIAGDALMTAAGSSCAQLARAGLAVGLATFESEPFRARANIWPVYDFLLRATCSGVP